jgi:hypothetical protein
MDSDDIYKYIGYTVAVIFFIYLISKALSLNVRLIEGLTPNSKNKETANIRNNKDNEFNTEDDSTKQKITDKKNQNKSINEDMVKNKDNYKDSLSAAYNNQLYALIQLSAKVGFTQDFTDMGLPDQTTTDNINKLKNMKDFLEILDFAYNEVDNL